MILTVLAFLAVAAFIVFFYQKSGQPKYYLLFVAYALPVMDLKITPFYFGDLRVLHAITLITLLIAGRRFFSRFRFLNVYSVMFFLFMAMFVLSSLASENAARALFSLSGIVLYFVFTAFFLQELTSEPAFIESFIKGLKFACLVALGFMGMQFIFGPQFTIYDNLNQNVTGGESIRFPGFFADSQLNGIFFGMGGFLWLFNFREPGKLSWSQLLMFSLMMCGLVMTGSRSPMIGVTGALAFLILFLRGNVRFQIFRYAAICGAGVLLFATTTDAFNRFQKIDDSYDFRRNIWEGAYEISKEHPILGIGSNNYQDYVMKHAQDQSIMLDNDEIMYLQFPENGYLKLLVEWGWGAFAIFMLILAAPLIKLFNYYFRNYDVRTATIAAAMLVCWFISYISVYSLADPRVAILLASAWAIITFFSEKQIPASEIE